MTTETIGDIKKTRIQIGLETMELYASIAPKLIGIDIDTFYFQGLFPVKRVREKKGTASRLITTSEVRYIMSHPDLTNARLGEKLQRTEKAISMIKFHIKAGKYDSIKKPQVNI